jgi:hypothetical protein
MDALRQIAASATSLDDAMAKLDGIAFDVARVQAIVSFTSKLKQSEPMQLLLAKLIAAGAERAVAGDPEWIEIVERLAIALRGETGG